MADLTYAEACELVRAQLVEEWGDTAGTLQVAEEGRADVLDYLVPWGAREWLVDGDPSFILMNNTATFVDRRTGDVRHEMVTMQLEKIDGMKPVSAG